jgi:hypothetical protein
LSAIISAGVSGVGAADQIEHGFGLFQRPGQRVGVALIGRMDPGRHDHAGIEIDGVLRFVGKVRGAVLHPGDARRRIGWRRPVGVRQGLALAASVEADQVLGTWCLDTALLSQTAQHLLVILAGVPPHQAAQGGIGFLGRGVDADPLGAYQVVLVRDLEQKAEHGVVDLQRQPRPGHAQR